MCIRSVFSVVARYTVALPVRSRTNVRMLLIEDLAVHKPIYRLGTGDSVCMCLSSRKNSSSAEWGEVVFLHLYSLAYEFCYFCISIPMNKMTVRNRRAYDRADSHKTSFQFPVCKGSIRCCIRLNYFVWFISSFCPKYNDRSLVRWQDDADDNWSSYSFIEWISRNWVTLIVPRLFENPSLTNIYVLVRLSPFCVSGTNWIPPWYFNIELMVSKLVKSTNGVAHRFRLRFLPKIQLKLSTLLLGDVKSFHAETVTLFKITGTTYSFQSTLIGRFTNYKATTRGRDTTTTCYRIH